MKFGVCGDPGIARFAAAAGFDYFEWSVASALKPLDNEEAFLESLEQIQHAALPCRALNVFIPAQLKITGPLANLEELKTFVSTACHRAKLAGVQTIVFGSGGARQVPEGFSKQTAWQQLADFCSMLGPVAAQFGIIVTIEPLNRNECNIINSVAEGAALTRQVNHPAIRLLIDAYHWAKEQETVEEIISASNLISHVHIATIANRRTPGAEPGDFSSFFQALHAGGYEGSISIEGRIDDPLIELPNALQLMKSF